MKSDKTTERRLMKESKKKLSFSKLGIKFIIPVILVIIISISSIGIIGYFSNRAELFKLMNEMTSYKVQEVEKLIKEREEHVEITKQNINEYLIMTTKVIAEYIKQIPEYALNYKLTKLANKLGISEIHLSDENGILTWGNKPEFYGYDFNSSEQSAIFMESLENKDFMLAQEPTPRGADNTLFQYIGVARQDKPGIVQIGLEPKQIQDMLERMNITTMSKSLKFGKGGYIAILDTNGIILSHYEEDMIGEDVKQYEWGQKVVSEGKGNFTFEFEGNEKVISFNKYDDKYIICAIVPTDEYFSFTKHFIWNAIINIILAILLVVIFLIVTTNRNLINPIRQLFLAMQEVGNGNLDVSINNHRKDEVGQLFKSFRDMIGKLHNVVINISDNSIKINEISDGLSSSCEQVSNAGQEVASSINEIVDGASDQVNEINKSITELDSLSSSIENMDQSTKIIKEQAYNINKHNIEGIEAINSLKDKIYENTKASDIVNEKVVMLSQRSNEIGNITDSITSIAGQTSLLALNASIEAARAGESGKGFAVVADEIRSLAEESSNAADTINRLINSIKQDVSEAVVSMQDANNIVKDVNDELENTVNVFGILKDSNETIIELIDNLNKIAGQLNSNKDIVAASVNSVASVAEETVASTQEISSASEEQSATAHQLHLTAMQLNEISCELAELVKIFHLSK